MSLHYTETLRGSYFLVETPDDVRACEVSINVRLPRPKGRVHEFEAEMTGTRVHITPVRLGYGFVGLGRPRA